MALAEEGHGAQNGEMDESAGKVEWPIDANKKHPLESRWTFWFGNNAKSKSGTRWDSNLRPVYTFSTVEEFWCIYSNVFQPSKLPSGADFHCFKYGIEPKWEDPKCANGGKWTANSNRGGKAGFDALWLETLLAMIGEQFEEGDEICGAVASVRTRQDKVALWTKTATNEATQNSIGRQWKEILDYGEKLIYTFHEDRKDDGRRDKSSNRYTV